MFDHFVWSVVATPLIVVIAGYLVADRLPPSVAAPAFAWSALGVATASGINLVVFGVKALAEVPAVASLGHWSSEVVIADTASVPWVSWLCLAWVVIATVAVGRFARKHRAAMAWARRHATDLPGQDQVVELPGPEVDAYAIPGTPGRIVVTAGMREILTPSQYAALVSHERAHLDGGHHRLVWAVRLAAIMHPALRPLVRRVEYLVERAADERAATDLGDRRGVARAIGAAALAANGRPAFSALHIGSPRPAAGAVPRRVMALLRQPRLSRRFAVVPVAFVVASLVWTGECVYDLQELLSAASTH
jgi:hypothetical protein